MNILVERLQVGKQMAEIYQNGIAMGNTFADHGIESLFEYCRPVIAAATKMRV
jgi:hypothetical protein